MWFLLSYLHCLLCRPRCYCGSSAMSSPTATATRWVSTTWPWSWHPTCLWLLRWARGRRGTWRLNLRKLPGRQALWRCWYITRMSSGLWVVWWCEKQELFMCQLKKRWVHTQSNKIGVSCTVIFSYTVSFMNAFKQKYVVLNWQAKNWLILNIQLRMFI